MGRVHRTNTKETRGARVTGRVIPSCIGFQGIGFQNLPIYFYTQHEEVRSRIRNPTRQTKVSCSLPMTNTHTHTQRNLKTLDWKYVVARLNSLIHLSKVNHCCCFVCDLDLPLFCSFLFPVLSLSPPSPCSPSLSQYIRLLLIRQPQAHLSARPYCM